MPIRIDELNELLYDPSCAPYIERIKALLEGPEFEQHEGLTAQEQAEIAYRRLVLIGENLGLDIGELADDPRKLFALHDWVGMVDGTVATVLGIHYSLCMGSLLHHGGGSPKVDSFLEELRSMSSIGVFLATELGYGNNVGRLETRADFDPTTREFTLHTPRPAARKFMPNTALAGIPKIAIVMARLHLGDADCGVFPFVMRLRDQAGQPAPGVQICPLGEKPAYALDNAMTSFDRCRLGEEQWLSGDDSWITDEGVFMSRTPSRGQRFMNAMDRVQMGRVCLTGSIVSLVRAAALIAIRYGSQRQTFAIGRGSTPIVTYRNYQRDVFGALASAYVMSVSMRYSQRLLLASTGEASGRHSAILAILKAVNSYDALDALILCRERVGAVGLFNENRIATYLNQTQGLITAEGDNQLVLMKAAREMMTGQDYAPPQVAVDVEPGARDLHDASFQTHLFRLRERRRCLALTEGMQKAIAEGTDPFTAWNAHVNAAIALARARGERVRVEQFQASLENVREPATHAALVRIASLHALMMLRRDAGWFLSEGCITAEQVRALDGEIDQLCAELEPDAEALAEGFDISNALLRSPIASRDYIAAYDARTRDAGAICEAGKPGGVDR